MLSNRNNLDIKAAAKEKGVFLYEVAEAYGMVDSCFSRKLRRELPKDEKQAIFKIIDEIASQKQNAV
jgi:lambda repressor-like predicted transcriptional regulator